MEHSDVETRRKLTAHKSSYIENVLLHRLVCELSSALWTNNPVASLQVFNSEVDDSGFDLVLKIGSVIRYVQVKQSRSGSKKTHCSVRLDFSKVVGSCIVLIAYKIEDLTITSCSLFANEPSSAMPEIKSYKASKSPGRRNAEGIRHIREHYRDVPISRFEGPFSMPDLLKNLFPTLGSLGADSLDYSGSAQAAFPHP